MATPRVTDPIFVKGATSVSGFPDWDRPEIAFGGRSNVGKSSLLRALIGARRLVRVSQTPGRTREVNFFSLELDGLPCAFVDLPGYGYARAPGRLKARWGRVVEDYVTGRELLAGLVLLVDSRRGPEAEEQELVAELGHRGRPCLVVFTKTDKVPRNRLKTTLQKMHRALGLLGRPLGFSAHSGEGKGEVLTRIRSLVERRSGTDGGK